MDFWRVALDAQSGGQGIVVGSFFTPKIRHVQLQADHLHKQLKGGPLEAEHDVP
jgi:hypothetical protein